MHIGEKLEIPWQEEKVVDQDQTIPHTTTLLCYSLKLYARIHPDNLCVTYLSCGVSHTKLPALATNLAYDLCEHSD